MTWNSSKYTLRKLKKQLKAIRKEDNPCISPDDIMEFISHLSKEAKERFKIYNKKTISLYTFGGNRGLMQTAISRGSKRYYGKWL